MDKKIRQLHVRGCRIGTSGWNYESWKDAFYPQGVKQKELLKVYAKTFATVELNNSFYHLPKRESVASWVAATPGDFLFAVKASRFLTHMKKLKDPQEPIDRLMKSLKPFGGKLGPILFQLPPRWRVNEERLEAFLAALPSGHRYAFEFRDRSWLCEPVYEQLRDHGAALCQYDYRGYRSPDVVTADFVYVRLHGPGERAYEGSYDGRTLAGFAKKFARWRREHLEIYCYFDNDQKSNAPFDARKLIERAEKQLV